MEAMAMVTSTADDDRYDAFLRSVQERASALIAEHGALFTTDAAGLWEAYLDAAPDGTRQVRTCNTCKYFFDRFAGLVTIDERGHAIPLLWNDETLSLTPPMYRDAVQKLARIVGRASVTGVFVPSTHVLGVPETGLWTHIALRVPESLVWTSRVQTAEQRMAERREEFGMLQRALAEFPLRVVREAHALLTGDRLYRSEKCIGVAKWLLDLREAQERRCARDSANLVWRAVASAPPGFCHVKQGMIGTLLEDVRDGLPFDVIKQRFDDKMDPLKYQRPVALPAAGNIAQAEKLVEKLGIARSLERRFAKLSDVKALWLPKPPKTERPAGGVFGHLQPKRAGDALITSDAPPVVMTWTKFAATVLPHAETIELRVPSRGNFTAFVTATHADAPPILQWDNPVSWYVYSGGSAAHTWNLAAETWHPLTAIVLQPSMWGAHPLSHQGQSAMLILARARDTGYQQGAGLFPELLRSDLHAVRATIEAYWRTAVITGRDEAEACGLRLQAGQAWDVVVRVTANGVRTAYRLDRWD